MYVIEENETDIIYTAMDNLTNQVLRFQDFLLKSKAVWKVKKISKIQCYAFKNVGSHLCDLL